MRNCFRCAAILIAITASAAAQLVAGNDQTGTATLWLIDVTGATPNRALYSATGGAAASWGLAADEVHQILYTNNGSTLYKASYDLVNPLVPTLIGTTTGTAPTGLAYDSVDQKLYARGSGGFYELNITTGVATLVFAITAQDFGGFDYDPVTDAFYGSNDSTSTTVLAGGRGIYRINKPLSAPTFTELADYPGTDTDIDGLAVGNGRLYLVNDNSTAGQGIYVFNLSTNSYETSLPNPFSATTGIFSGGAWAPGLFIPPTGSNMAITVSDTPDPVVPPGGNITYTITVTNTGPDPATGVAVSDTLPGNVNFVSVTPPGSHAAGVISANIGDMAASASVSFDVVVQTTGAGTVSNTATVSSTSTDPVSGNNTATATTTVRDFQADLALSATAPAACAVGPGGIATFGVTVTNNGPETANNVVLIDSLPFNATFISSTPPVTPVAGTLTFNIGTLAPAGSAAVSINVQVINPGDLVTNGATASANEQDPNAGNNNANASTTVAPSVPAVANAKGVLSTLVASSTSLVPGLGTVRFSSTGGLDRPFRSSNGQHWILRADTDAATTSDQVLLVGDSSTFAVAAQEGTFPSLPTNGGPFPPFSFDIVQGINDSGDIAFSGIDARSGTTDDGFLVKVVGSTVTLVAQEATTPVPGMGGGVFFGSTRGSVSIQNDGTTSFYHTLAGTGITTSNDTAVFTDDGNTLIAQESVTTPSGQAFGPFAYSVFDTGATLGFGLSLDTTGANYALTGQVGTVTANDKVGVVNGAVQIQEGVVLPGTSYVSPTEGSTPIEEMLMESNGVWYSYGGNADGQDWVLRNGAVVAERGAPVVPASAEVWDDASYTQLYYFAFGNNNCDYIIGGVTNGPAISNAVLTLNGKKVVVRENDPVDLDNNGLFDDGVYIRTFRDDQAFLTDDRVLYVVVRLRDANAAQCGATDTDIGQALLRIRVGVPGDIDLDGCVNEVDLGILLGAWNTTAAGDLNCDGQTSEPDLGILLANWQRGCQ
ncbi:MAG: DUF11 domain-containing protein [Phycisphaerae bacterium]